MSIEVSTYKKILKDEYTTNQHIQLFTWLPLNALTETYLRGVITNNIKK
jgi:hypothetical protein